MKKIICLLITLNIANITLCAELSQHEAASTSLAQAIYNSDIEMMRVLLKSGADHNEVGYFDCGHFKFKCPIKAEFEDIARNEFKLWSDRTNRFHYEINQREIPQTIYELINNGIFLHSEHAGMTPLLAAINNIYENCNLEIVKQLIALKADINQPTGSKMTPLEAAININNIECTKLLLEEGADINKRGGFIIYAPIHRVITEMHKVPMELINLLLKFRPAVNICCEFLETSPLACAFSWMTHKGDFWYLQNRQFVKTQEEIIKIIDELLEQGANPYFKEPTTDKITLQRAEGNEKIFKLIQEKTANKILAAWESFPTPLARLIAQYTVTDKCD